MEDDDIEVTITRHGTDQGTLRNIVLGGGVGNPCVLIECKASDDGETLAIEVHDSLGSDHISDLTQMFESLVEILQEQPEDLYKREAARVLSEGDEQ